MNKLFKSLSENLALKQEDRTYSSQDINNLMKHVKQLFYDLIELGCITGEITNTYHDVSKTVTIFF